METNPHEPNKVVVSAQSESTVVVKGDEKAFMDRLCRDMLENLKTYLRTRSDIIPERVINDREMLVRYKDGHYSVAVPILSVQPLPGFEYADRNLHEYAKKVDVFKIDRYERTWFVIRGNNLRDVVNTWQEGLLREVAGDDLCVNYDALSKEYGVDPGRKGRNVA